MKKILILLVLPFMMLFNINLAKAQVIEGRFEGEVSTEWIYLKCFKDLNHSYGEILRMDSARIENGGFRFELDHDLIEPRFGVLFQKTKLPGRKYPSEHSAKLILAQDSILIYTSDSLKNMRVFNSRVNYDYSLYKQWVAPAEAKYHDSLFYYIQDDQKHVPEQVIKTAEFQRFSLKRIESLRLDRLKAYRSFIEKYQDSWISLHVIYSLSRLSITTAEDLIPLFDALTFEIKSSAQGRELYKYLKQRKALGIGMDAPDFFLPDTAGNTVRLTDLRGKYVLIEFTASWCGGCRREAPHLVGAYNEFYARGFDILSVSFDDDKKGDGKQKWMRAIQEDGTGSFKHVSDLKGMKDSPIAKLYQVLSIPQNFLLDPEGKIVGVNLNGTALREKLQQLLKNQIQ